jgi:DNA-binding PadR family transcriptional regulator
MRHTFKSHPHHRPFEGGPPGFGRGGRRKLFDAAALRLIFLQLVEAQPRHGYDIIREVETQTGGAYAPSPGIVYPTLTLLEELGHIEASASDGAKRLFAITQAGRAFLAENRPAVDAAMARLESLRADEGREDIEPVRRAVQNLRAVLHHRLNGRNDKETAFSIADILDDAARKIERL